MVQLKAITSYPSCSSPMHLEMLKDQQVSGSKKMDHFFNTASHFTHAALTHTHLVLRAKDALMPRSALIR